MAVDVSTVSAGRRVVPALPTASILLLGCYLSLFGLTWDVQWHVDVGPDTFFTLPHLFIYAGSAVSGLAALTAVLSATAVTRAGGVPDPLSGGRGVAVFGRMFSAPVGYLIAGTGAALFLVYGLWDQWWHGVYGFDAVIDSPPHIGLLLSVMITLVGAATVFAAAGGLRWGRVGLVLSLAGLATFSTVTVLGFSTVQEPVQAVTVALSWLMVVILMTAAGFGGRGTAWGVALGTALLQAVGWWFAPWAARVYAGFVGLPLRDHVRDVPVMPALTPMVLIPVAVLVTGVLLLNRPWAWHLAGALGAVVIAAVHPVQDHLVRGLWYPAPGVYAATLLLSAVLGLTAGYLGRWFGQALALVRVGRGTL